MGIPRFLKIILWTLTGLLLALALCVVLALTFNWNHAKPWITQQLSELAGRKIAIAGDLSLQWKQPPTQTGWRGWMPWLRITAEQITVDNPPGIKPDAKLVQADRLSVLLDPWPLMNQTVRIAELDLSGAKVSLERLADGKNNWSFKQSVDENDEAAPSKWKFVLQKLNLQRVGIQVADAADKLDIKADIDSLKEPTAEGYGIGWTVGGSYNGAAISGKGQAGTILSLQNGSAPFPLHGNLKAGETTIDVEGSITRPADLAALDLRLKLKGATMSDLYPLIGVALPHTPPYATEGRLIGRLDTANDTWTYQDFKGKVGASDLEGTLDYAAGKPRSLLTGRLESKLLRFKDLGPLIGVHSGGDETKDKTKQPAGKALPVNVIGTDQWDAMDADVHFTGQKIVQTQDLPLDDVKAHILLKNRVLTLDPLDFGVAGGNLDTTIKLDGQAPRIKASMNVSARHLKLRKLLRGAESMKASLGELNGDAKLTGEGTSIAELLGGSNGEVKAVVSKGTISHLLLETAGLNVANIVMVKIFGDDQIVLNCLASDFNVANGLMKVQAFKLDTQDAIIDVTGDINLATERLDLDVKPENKSVRVFTLRTPLYVKGTFKNPDVGVHKGPLVARAGAAILLGVVATPLAALAPLLNFGTDDSNECASLIAQSKQKPKAPPPGKTKKAESKTGAKTR